MTVPRTVSPSLRLQMENLTGEYSQSFTITSNDTLDFKRPKISILSNAIFQDDIDIPDEMTFTLKIYYNDELVANATRTLYEIDWGDDKKVSLTPSINYKRFSECF